MNPVHKKPSSREMPRHSDWHVPLSCERCSATLVSFRKNGSLLQIADIRSDEPSTQKAIIEGNAQTLRLARAPQLRKVLCNSRFIQKEWLPLTDSRYQI